MDPNDYFTGTNGYRVHRQDPNRYEHRDAWEEANGPIPAGHHIHHKNKKRDDNRLDNLECLAACEHKSMHGSEPDRVKALLSVRRLSEKRPFTCERCGKNEKTDHHSQRFCSRFCRKKFFNTLLSKKRLMDRRMKREQGVCSNAT